MAKNKEVYTDVGPVLILYWHRE